MEGKPFKLGEYRITDFGYGLIGWEAQGDFGVQRSGRCFQLGQILVLGDPEEEKSGYLKGEFLDLLRKLPPWSQTRYYCLANQLQRVRGGRLDNNLLREMVARPLSGRDASERAGAEKIGPFRLGRYRISATQGREVIWETWGEGQAILTGNCALEAGFLILAPTQGFAGEQNKKEFIRQLRRLPLWQETPLWCRQEVLHLSQVPIKPRIGASRQGPLPQKTRHTKTEAVEKMRIEKKAGKSLRDRLGKWRPLLPLSLRGWSPRWPDLHRARSFWASGSKLLSPAQIRSRWSRPKKPGGPSFLEKANINSRWVWISLTGIILLLILLLAALYILMEEGHDHYRHWNYRYKSRDH